MKQIVIAIDGYSSSGKSTMARTLARELGYRYIDTGSMYRAVTLYAMRNGWAQPDGSIDEQALAAALPQVSIDWSVGPDGQHTLLNGEDVETEIRGMAVSALVSPVAALPTVRRALTELQKRLGASRGVVMDGRDIGTAVFPDAELKVFVTASAQTRAQRRLAELVAKGVATSFEEVLANVVHRDHIDETREVSPLRRADDALLLDNSCLTPAEQDSTLLEMARNAIARANGK